MAKEIERKFLVTDDSYRRLASRKTEIRQGYLCTLDPDGDCRATVRVRRADERAFITVKGSNHGAVRDEWEYPVPAADADAMLSSLAVGNVIDKTRYYVEYEGFVWEVDEFHGVHSGLVIAEIELPSEDTAFALPPFVGREVTGDPRYYNSSLSRAD